MRRLAPTLFFALVATSAAGSGVARADDQDRCLTAPVEGQKLQRAGRLLDARERFSTCASDTCPAEIIADCTRWARAVDDAMPLLVFVARDDAGHDVVDARVSVDGKPEFAVSGRAVPLDPGSHHVVFRRAKSTDIVSDVLVREGEKNRSVVATFPAPVSTKPPPIQEPPKRPPPALRESRPVPAAAWMAGTVSVLGFTSFAIFGGLGVDERSAKQCDQGCSSSDKSSVDSKLRIADISLGIGVVALGVAVVLYLTRPAHAAPATTAVMW